MESDDESPSMEMIVFVDLVRKDTHFLFLSSIQLTLLTSYFRRSRFLNQMLFGMWMLFDMIVRLQRLKMKFMLRFGRNHEKWGRI